MQWKQPCRDWEPRVYTLTSATSVWWVQGQSRQRPACCVDKGSIVSTSSTLNTEATALHTKCFFRNTPCQDPSQEGLGFHTRMVQPMLPGQILRCCTGSHLCQWKAWDDWRGWRQKVYLPNNLKKKGIAGDRHSSPASLSHLLTASVPLFYPIPGRGVTVRCQPPGVVMILTPILMCGIFLTPRNSVTSAGGPTINSAWHWTWR